MQRILERLKPLETSGAISELQILQQSNQLETLQDELIQLQNRREEIANSSEARKNQLEGNLKQVENQLRNELVRAPISGTVFNLKPDNSRYVTTNAEALLRIVPRGHSAEK